jgi:hypothetical protein
MNTQQTAVEWLYKEIIKKSVNDPSHNVLYILQQANKMFEQQIIDAVNFGDERGKITAYKTAEQYYSETFNK